MKLLLALSLLSASVALGEELSPPADLQPQLKSEAGPSLLQVRTWQLAAGAGATAVAVPAGLYLGSLAGGISNNLILAALPAAVIFLVLPTLAVTAVEWAVGNHFLPGSVRWQPAMWTALGVNFLALVGGTLLGVNVGSVGSVALFTLVGMVVLPSAVTGVMALTSAESPVERRRPESMLPRQDHRPLTVTAWEMKL